MEAADRLIAREQIARKRKRRALWFGGAFILILIGVGVGLAVGFKRRSASSSGSNGGSSGDSSGSGSSNSKSSTGILVPIYSDPAQGSWDPLLTQAKAQKGVNFTAIVNPNNGPETPSSLSQSYQTTISNLNNQTSNARVVGYIDTVQGTKSVDSVLSDSRSYAAWSYPNGQGAFRLGGLYFDDVSPMKDNASETNYLQIMDWMKNLGQGKTFGSDPVIIHNAHTVPSYFDNTTDITVVFDGTYAEWTSQKATLAGLNKALRPKLGIMVNGVSSGNIKTVVQDASQIAGQLYVTDGDSSYKTLGSTWSSFVGAVANLS